MHKNGFDNAKYLAMQSEHIEKRIAQFGGKLYLEFGGKLFDDYHASRVLPGFVPDAKLQLLLKMKDEAEIVIAINSQTIEEAKTRGDLGITYDQEVLRLIDAFRAAGLYVSSVVLTQFQNQKSAKAFEKLLQKLGIKTYRHYVIEGYPYDVEKIVSEDGLGKNDYIETTRPLVVLTAPGPGSGKMATCLSQLYHDNKRGLKSGYAKFETFPIWNLPLKHPVNLAYEAATADLDDVNMIDPYHLEHYGISTVNYNRDIEIFPVLNRVFEKIFGASPYYSPTDMGVNMAGFCIENDEVCQEASRQEIIRRYLKALVKRREGQSNDSEVAKIDSLMKNNGIEEKERKVIAEARNKAEKTGGPAASIELEDGSIISGKNSPLLRCNSAMILNALKHLAGIRDSVLLIPKAILEPICKLKTESLGGHNPRLHLDEILLALSISAVTNPLAGMALEQLPKLRGCQSHSTVILSEMDNGTLRKLGVDHTSDPVYETKKLYHGK
ncbi:MAG: DUF1846 domain-containing protein [Candidatus Enteromonas sp.]|nr:DUF1846 domain-containing protein [bacterium]MDY6101207.1 DUF1846 domain-containing protein [Candidatus Enteromonas sp.]